MRPRASGRLVGGWCCYGCGARREYVVSAGRPLLDLSRGCPSCGGVRTAESIERAPALMLIEGDMS